MIVMIVMIVVIVVIVVIVFMHNSAGWDIKIIEVRLFIGHTEVQTAKIILI